MVASPFRMSGSGRESLSNVCEWLAGPPGCPGVFRMPSRMSGSGLEVLPDVSGRDALPNVREWSGGSPKCQGVVGRVFRMSVSGGRPFWISDSCREAPRMSGRPSRVFESHRDTLPHVCEWLGGPPGCP